RVAIRLWGSPHALEPEELSLEIEVALVRPGPLHNIEPFLGEVIARVVLTLGDAEHLEFTLVPADHKVDAETSFADVVDGYKLLCGDQWVEQRRMHCAKDNEAFGSRKQTGSPGDGLERCAMKIGFPPVALPAADRQHEIDPGLLGHARESEAIGPVCRPTFR